MKDFWKNISRYPRFFLSSIIGLILIIITPIRNLFKLPKLRAFVIFLITLAISATVLILRRMTGL